MLILDRDVDYREELAAELKAAGAQVEIASKAEEGLARAIALQPELVMVGLGIEPRKEDLDLLPQVWEATAAPVLVLQEGPASRKGLEQAARAGAVACLNKGDVHPRAAAGFATSQLAALGRTPSRFRRSGDAVLDVMGRSLRVGEKKVPLTRMQAEILAVLLEPPTDDWKPIRVIARRVFGDGARGSVVRKHVNRLRVKFARARLDARIDTAHARGYRLVTGRRASLRLAALGRSPSRSRRSADAILDVVGGSLRVGASEVALTRKQAEILAVLLEPPTDEWKPIAVIAHRVFGGGASDSVVPHHINQLRVKFARARLDARIETALALGYRLVAVDRASSRGGRGQGGP